MNIQYAVNVWNSIISKVVVSRETEHNIWLAANQTRRERKYHKGSSQVKFFPTWDKAHRFLLDKKETMVRVTISKLAKAEKELKLVKTMKEE